MEMQNQVVREKAIELVNITKTFKDVVANKDINLTLYKLDKIMNGDIQEIIDACIAADQAAKLAKMNETA